MFLRRVDIRNFQSWINADIEFSKGFNVIDGDSDSGKSGILKAIEWVEKNRPMGEEFKSWDSSKDERTTVTLRFDDTKITKKREKGKNYYKLPDGTVLSAFKAQVPDEVKKICNFKEYNIQSQHQNYFLLQTSPGERAKILNKAIGLDVIDNLFSYINSEILQINRELKVSLSDKKKIKKELEKYEDLDDAETAVHKLQEKIKQFTENEKIINKSFVLLVDIKKNNKKIEAIKNRLVNEQKIARILALTDKWRTLDDSIFRGRETLNKAIKIRNRTLYINNNLKENIADYVQLLSENKVCPTCGTTINKEIVNRIKSRL